MNDASNISRTMDYACPTTTKKENFRQNITPPKHMYQQFKKYMTDEEENMRGGGV